MQIYIISKILKQSVLILMKIQFINNFAKKNEITIEMK